MSKYLNIKTIGIGVIVLLVLCLFLSKTIYSFNMPQITATMPFSGKLSKTETAIGVVSGAEDDDTQDKIEALQIARAKLNLDIENINIKVAKTNEDLAATQAEREREVARVQTAYDRAQSLFEVSAISASEMETAEYNLQSTIAKYDKQISDYQNTLTTYRQDIRGKQLDIQSNDLQMRPYKDAIASANGEPVITATLPLENTFVTIGDEVRLSNSIRSFKGIVEEITTGMNNKTVTIVVAADQSPSSPTRFGGTTDTQPPQIEPGESYTITFTKEGERSERMVPNGAVQQDSEGHFLYRIKQRKGVLGNEYHAEKVRIYIGDSDNSNTVILNDIGFFEPVVLSSNKSFVEGETITLKNAGDFFAKD